MIVYGDIDTDEDENGFLTGKIFTMKDDKDTPKEVFIVKSGDVDDIMASMGAVMSRRYGMVPEEEEESPIIMAAGTASAS